MKHRSIVQHLAACSLAVATAFGGGLPMTSSADAAAPTGTPAAQAKVLSPAESNLQKATDASAASDSRPDDIATLIASLGDEARRSTTTEALRARGVAAVPALLAAYKTERKVRNATLDILVKLGPTAVPELTKGLNHQTAEVRQRAIFALRKIRPQDITPLVHATGDSNGDVRMLATDALGDFGASAAISVPVLIERLGDRDERVRVVAVEALGAVGFRAKDKQAVVQALVKVLESRPLRSRAADALGRLGDAAVPELIKLVASRDPSIREAAVYALGAAGVGKASVVPVLAPLLRDADDTLRLLVANSLGKIGPVAVPALTKALADKTLPEPWLAGLALALIGPEASEAMPVLVAAIEQPDASPEMCSVATVALGRIGVGAKGALPALRKLATRAAGETQLNAATALWQIAQDPLGLDTLAKTLVNDDAAVRLASASILADIGPGADKAVPALAQALEDRDAKVRATAAWALASIGSKAQSALPALKAALPNASGEFKMNLGLALWAVSRDAQAENILLETLSCSQADVRAASAMALVAISLQGAKVVPALVERVAKDEQPRVRSAAALALAEIGPPAKEAIAPISKAMESAVGEERVCLAFAQWSIDGRIAAIEELVEALDLPDAGVRLAAAGALAQIGPAARQAISALNAALDDYDPRVRQMAEVALTRIHGSAVCSSPGYQRCGLLRRCGLRARMHAVGTMRCGPLRRWLSTRQTCSRMPCSAGRPGVVNLFPRDIGNN